MSRLVLLFVSILLVTAMLTFVTSAYFTISEVVFEGNRYYMTDELLLMTGIRAGTNLFQLNVNNITNSLLKHPRIKDVKIEKLYPSRLRITIEEREGVALLPFGDSFLELGPDGVIVSVLDTPGASPSPIIVGANPIYTGIGRRLECEALDIALLILRQLDKHVVDELSEINVGNMSNIRLFTEDGIEVMLGEFGDGSTKLAAFKAFLDEYKATRSKIQSVDLRIDNKMTIREKR